MSARVAMLTLSFLSSHPQAAAAVLDAMETSVAVRLFASLPARVAAPVLTVMQPDQAARVVAALPPVLAASMVRAMPYLDRVTVLRLLSDQERAAIFVELPSRVIRDVTRSLAYPQGTVGAWMESSIAVFRTSSRVSDACRYVQRNQTRTLSHVFLLGPGRRLHGAVALASLIRFAGTTQLADIERSTVQPLSNRARIVEVSRQPAWDEFTTLPVVGRKGNVLGGLSRTNLRRALRAQPQQGPHSNHVRAGSHLLNAWLLSASGLFRVLTGQRLS